MVLHALPCSCMWYTWSKKVGSVSGGWNVALNVLSIVLKIEIVSQIVHAHELNQIVNHILNR